MSQGKVDEPPVRPTITGQIQWPIVPPGFRSKAAGLLGIVVFLGLLWLILQITRRGAPPYSWDFGIVPAYLPTLRSGLAVTLLITGYSILLGAALGLFVAIGRLSKTSAVRLPVTAYIELMRGTPVLVQLVWVFYALPILTGLKLPGVESAILAFTLNLGAFYGEAFRAGIQSVPQEQVETAEALGLSHRQRMQYVIVPQAARNVLPVLLSTSLNLFKDTSLVSFIGVQDLMFAGNSAAINTYRPMEILSTVALIYLIVAFPTTVLVRRLEIHVSRHLRS